MNHDKYDQTLAEQAAREHRREYYYNNQPTTNNKMKQYRISIPAIVTISVAAGSEEQAKRLAAAATYTPDSPLSSLERNSFNNLLDVAVWVNDEVFDNHDKCVVLDTRSFAYEPSKLERQLEEFALSNNNSREYYKALNGADMSPALYSQLLPNWNDDE